MNTIQGEIEFKIEIKKSEFICHIKNVDNVNEAQQYIERIKTQHNAATHNCSVYKIGQIQKVDDDGEPSGTAGMPMLGVLEHHDIDNVVCVVTRYFGGIKLGAGGLIRAYAKSVSQTINSTQLIKLVKGFLIQLQVNFDANDSVNYYLQKNNIPIENKEYLQKVTYTVKVNEKQKEKFMQDIETISHLIKIDIKENIMMVDNE